MSPTYPFRHSGAGAAERHGKLNRLPHFIFEPGEWSVEMQELVDTALRDEHGILAEFLRGREAA